jgi:alkylation response protein AidB-like acyl-CoA dehydrogenase
MTSISREGDRDYQGVRWKLAEMYREIEMARGILYRACATANPFPDPFMAAGAKITSNETNRVTSEAIQLHGGFGFTAEFAVSRLYRGARWLAIATGRRLTAKYLNVYTS